MRKKSISLVFWRALAICTLFVIYGAIFPKQLEIGTQNIGVIDSGFASKLTSMIDEYCKE